MNSKERVIAAINHQETDRLPIDFTAREETVRSLAEHFKAPDFCKLLEILKVDLWGVGPQIKQSASPICYADPTVRVAKDPEHNQDVYYDIWGVGFVEKHAQDGTYIDLLHSPLDDRGSLDDLTNYPFPTADMWDYRTIRAQVEQNKNYFVWAHSRGFFEISWFMRGMNNFLVDLMANTEYAELLMDRIAEYLTNRTVRTLEAVGEGAIDCVEINDDVGSQNGLLISPDMWRQFVKPRMRKMIDRFREYGVFIRYHSCGGIRPIIPDLIEIGVDILNPVQCLARGMDLRELKQEYGHELTFDGGIDTQELLPHKRGDEFEQETRAILRMMGRSGGYIMAPAHAIQVDVPLDNVLKLYEIASLPYERI